MHPNRNTNFARGELISMAGGTESHSLITSNVLSEMHGRLKEFPCRVYDSNLRVRLHRSERYVYPDALVVCDPRVFDPDDPRQITITNPKLIVEVLSESTELIDRSEKFASYIKCPAIEEYVLVSQKRPWVETYFRQDDGTWRFSFFDGVQAIARLRSLAINLPLSDVYAKVDFGLAI